MESSHSWIFEVPLDWHFMCRIARQWYAVGRSIACHYEALDKNKAVEKLVAASMVLRDFIEGPLVLEKSDQMMISAAIRDMPLVIPISFTQRLLWSLPPFTYTTAHVD